MTRVRSKKQALRKVHSAQFRKLVESGKTDKVLEELSNLVDDLTGTQKFVVVLIVIISIVIVLLLSIMAGILLARAGVTDIGWLTAIPATALGGLIGVLGVNKLSE